MHRIVRRLQRVVAHAVEHVLQRPAGHGYGAVLVQAVLQQRAAGEVLVHLAVDDGAGRAGGRAGGLALGSGLRRPGLQRGGRVGGRQAQQAVVEAAGHGRLGQLVQAAAPDQLEAAPVGGLQPRMQGRVVQQPFAAHLDPGAAGGRVLQQVGQQLAVLRRQQQPGRMGVPELLQRAQQVRGIDGGAAVALHVELHARQPPLCVPQGAVTENEIAENGLGHGMV